ncbi:DUF4307 domain-containing protein [Microbacterium sp. ARD32]|uniref:DUF4307 domain-containing protein n=1 Tax=Microbacterium sp. ARD32 TaxID=2962577 RepID=UPI002881092B|nr:DUF4307 domain-containing protein [Microbacterium sp. ARD32]MDT0156610.1 DUF4307 domain-containing protein [Microbacterium sp. ARD32]
MTTARELDERYGRTGRRRLPWIVAGALAVLAVGAFGWMTVTSQLSAVSADDVGFTLTDEHSVDLRFQYTAPRGSGVVCVVQALDKEFGVVGWKVLEIPASQDHTSVMDVRIPTVAAATTGLVKSCWVA